jgi:hypothetical protein
MRPALQEVIPLLTAAVTALVRHIRTCNRDTNLNPKRNFEPLG